MTTFSHTFDTATPAGSDDPAEADDRMREIKAAVQERENVDHYWPKTGTEVSDTDAGEHRKITLRTLSDTVVAALSATKAYLYRLVTDGELYFKDASDNTIQLTKSGKILSASLDMKDEDDMSSDSATHATTQQATKAYADAIGTTAAAALAAAVPDDNAFGSWVAKSVDTVYEAATDGFVTAYCAGVDANDKVYGKTDSSTPPTTIVIADKANSTGASGPLGICFPVKKGDYWKVSQSGGSSWTIKWLPIGG